jgi:hypothetical protein
MQSNLLRKKVKNIQNIPDQILTKRFSIESNEEEKYNLKEILKRKKVKVA